MDGKTKAIVAHITWIGWIIALILNSSEKDEIASFFIRQLLGLNCNFVNSGCQYNWLDHYADFLDHQLNWSD